MKLPQLNLSSALNWMLNEITLTKISAAQY